MTTVPSPDPALIDKLVVANRILYDQGVVDGFGHVSVRHDQSPAHFLLARNMAPALVHREDIVTFDLDGTALDANGRRVYLERFIHGEIYRARPDVHAVVHSPSPSVIPFGVTRQPLRPVFHMSGFLGQGTALFDIRDTAGDTDMLISSGQLGKALAASLGARSTVLMRGHGSTVVAPTLRVAVYRAVYTEINARLLADAMRLGPVELLTAEEAKAAMTTNEGQIDRPWEFWKMRARRA